MDLLPGLPPVGGWIYCVPEPAAAYQHLLHIQDWATGHCCGVDAAGEAGAEVVGGAGGAEAPHEVPDDRCFQAGDDVGFGQSHGRFLPFIDQGPRDRLRGQTAGGALAYRSMP